MTPLELKTLDIVRERLTVAGFAPTISELCDETGNSRQNVHTALSRLVDRGLLLRLPHRRRGLSLPGLPDLRAAPSNALRAELARRGETLDALDGRRRGSFRRAVTCAADCCHVAVKPGMLFCRRHWFQLPVSLQQDIKGAFGAQDEALYGLYVTEARDRIDRGARPTEPRRDS